MVSVTHTETVEVVWVISHLESWLLDLGGTPDYTII